MGKALLLICASMLLSACTVEDENYYRRNPQVLQQALKNCPDKKPSHISCEQLATLAASVNELAYQLQMNPQGFGKKILALQETLAKQRLELENNPNQPELKSLVEKNKQDLTQRLAIVRWLESPES
ncbi:hypothetical protein [Legionella hackeliae]|uniref:Secreted endonuclease n=2 Tax=Legionella hackeliae TaxID=449 RepID=A0A0A8UQ25_LEGHA|nr:hypothetical protein [Legionella hackeliae]KTD09705.1 secreted endonuclease [Legionella hackeliae]CEK10970.1 conserved protein of unknown function [Legionella hackeliae]STX47710.1 secreted endonuclease [Legionella hackeliae]